MATNVNLLDRVPDTLISALGWTLAPWENPTGLLRPLIRDYSKHNGEVDFGVASLNGVLLAAIRSTISWGYRDPRFDSNWPQPALFNMYRTSYHVLYPRESVVRQADNWYKANPTIDLIPRTIDAELQHDAPPNQVADATWELSNICLARDGVRPLIYSRYMFINHNFGSWTADMLNDHKWWLAQYLWDRTREHPGPPTLPHRVREENVIIHQTADKKAGFPGEVENTAADYNRWELGTEAEMHQYIINTWGGGTVPPVPPIPAEPELELPIIISGMHQGRHLRVTVDVEDSA